MIPNRMGGGRYGLHERYSEEERQHYQHFADHQSHEAGVYGKAAENQTPGGGVKAVF